MTIDASNPEQVASRSAKNQGAAVPVDDGPTAESPIPCFDDEDDVLPDIDEPDTHDTVLLDLSRVVEKEAASAPKERSSWLQRVRESARLQLALLSAAGLVITGWLVSEEPLPTEVPPPVASDVPRFPMLPIEGAEPVTEEEIARRMRAAEPEASDPDTLLREELMAIAALGRERVQADDVTPHRRTRSARAGDIDESKRPRARRRRGRDAASTVDQDARKDSPVRGWFSPGGTMKIEGAPDPQAPVRLPLAVGERILAKLEVGISSGHAAPVLARVTKSVSVEGRVIVPEGTLAKGSFRSDGRRVYLNFTELIIPDGGRLTFDGYAVDRKVPGLVAIRRELGPEDGGSKVLEETVGVAKDVVRSVASGSIVGRVAQGVTDGVLPEGERGKETGVILEVEAGTPFQIVVTGGAK